MIKSISIVIAFVAITLVGNAQKQPKTITTSFWVNSACGLCENTIEKAMDTKGVVTADYMLETQMLTVTYKPAKISENKLHELLNEVGYDTEKSKCSDEQYSRVHHCCKYREMEKH